MGRTLISTPLKAYGANGGLDRVGEAQPAGWAYHLPDALGSVRQLTDADAGVTLVRSYEPFGSVMSSSGSGVTNYSFTGEWADGTGLMHLRARYYAPIQGRFLSKDAMISDPSVPMSIHLWLYVYANPINLFDPSGFSPPSPVDHRNLTNWLYREMLVNARDPEIIEIAENNKKASDAFEHSHTFILGLVFKGFAFRDFKKLVEDNARWDFKDAIKNEFRGSETIALCHMGGCDWYEYSVPGNIHYGYVGRAAGFSRLELHAGASYAEIRDHEDELEKAVKLFEKIRDILGYDPCISYPFATFIDDINIYFNYGWISTGFDDPTDYNAVELGISVFDSNAYPLNLISFARLLQEFSPKLDHMDDPMFTLSNPNYPYPNGYFDGGR